MDGDRLVLDLTFLSGGPHPDFDRVGELAQVLHDAPAPFEGHLFRSHLLFSFPRRHEQRFIASCAAFVSALNHEGRIHRGQLVDAITREYDRGRVHRYAVNATALPAIVVSDAIVERVRPVFPHSALARYAGETVITPFAAVEQLPTSAGRSAWLRECRVALTQTAASPALECPRFDWLFEMLDAASASHPDDHD